MLAFGDSAGSCGSSGGRERYYIYPLVYPFFCKCHQNYTNTCVVDIYI